MGLLSVLLPALLLQASGTTRPQAHYEPLPQSSDWNFEEADGGPAVRRALADTGWPSSPPLLEGWISSTIYLRHYPDRQVYFVLVDEDAAEVKYVCKVSFDGPPAMDSNYDGDAALAKLGLLCERENLIPRKSRDPRRVYPAEPAGPEVGESMSYTTPDGKQLTIFHVTNTSAFLPALPKGIDSAPLFVGVLPFPRNALPSMYDKISYIRDERGDWGVSIKIGYGGPLARSGCFVTNRTDASEPPSHRWVTTEALEWCRARQEAYRGPVQPGVLQPPAPGQK